MVYKHGMQEIILSDCHNQGRKMIEEIEHLNHPERIKQLLAETFPHVHKMRYET